MPSVNVAARFGSREELETALCDLRRLGAVHCFGAMKVPSWTTAPVLHVSVRPGDESLARAILRRAGGAVL